MSDLQRMLARNGVRIGAVYDNGSCKSPDDVARQFGLKPIGQSWREVNRATACTILRNLLERELAHGTDTDSAPHAAELAIGFIQEFSEGAKFYTNALWINTTDSVLNMKSMEQWTPATESTFDSGILVFHSHRVGVYWIEDED